MLLQSKQPNAIRMNARTFHRVRATHDEAGQGTLATRSCPGAYLLFMANTSPTIAREGPGRHWKVPSGRNPRRVLPRAITIGTDTAANESCPQPIGRTVSQPSRGTRL